MGFVGNLTDFPAEKKFWKLLSSVRWDVFNTQCTHGEHTKHQQQGTTDSKEWRVE